MIALDAILEEHEDAIAYDLIALGLRLRELGSKKLTWGDLAVIIRQAPRFSALFRAMYPEESQWGLAEQLLAANADLNAIAAWQRGGGSQKDYPKPIPRPGVEADTKFGSNAMSIDDMDDWLGWNKTTDGG